MLEKTRGIFLHSVKYSETSIIAVIYTEAYGRQSFVVIEIYYKAGREIHRMKDVRISNPFSTIPFDIRKSSQVIFLAEILYKCLKEEEPNPGLFNFIFNSLSFLDLSEHGISNFHVWFLFKLTQFLGIYPSRDNASVSNFFDLQKAQFVSHEPIHNQFTDKHITRLFATLFDVDYASVERLEYSQNERRQLLDKLLEYGSDKITGYSERSFTMIYVLNKSLYLKVNEL